MRTIFIGVLLIASAAGAADVAQFPVKPIRMVVPFGAGSNTDILARTVAVRMSESWGQQVIVDNRPGAGGNIGTDLVAKALPDGYTIVLGPASVLAINQSLYSQMPYDSNTAFAPITNMVKTTNVLIVTPSLPAKSVKELIAHGKANPGKLIFGSAGAGGTQHLSGELFKSMTGVDMLHIGYKSSPLAHIDIISGQVQLMFDGMPAAVGNIKAGKLKVLAISGATRHTNFPDVPTFTELGMAEFEPVAWLGLFAPAGTPQAILNKVGAAVAQGVKAPDFIEQWRSFGGDPVGSTPAEFSAFIKADQARWKAVISRAGVKLD